LTWSPPKSVENVGCRWWPFNELRGMFRLEYGAL
jgi:hypothetical protein